MLLPCDAPECAAEKAEKEAKIKAAQEEQEAQHDVMDDARDNFGSIVEDYVSQNSPDGYFPLRQKGSGKTLKLRFKGLQPGSLKKVSAGHVAGVVAMTNAETRRLVMVDFFVDFSTPHWAVERASLAAPRSKAQGPAGSAGAH
jgi:hypothetical protein